MILANNFNLYKNIIFKLFNAHLGQGINIGINRG